ncbi:SPOR domain-containing protein [Sphingomonas japonica]|uniref:SPOR domain-containing protein n=1 Tax=Sphingomonas japonica TaxID=511662 RepID=A0ABX0U183_9SPHN|nr:SPOR domain-containing protein [Sphingomonas japonica]NIJ24331.1 hypothetical protein [Sphingomonas japonica]
MNSFGRLTAIVALVCAAPAMADVKAGVDAWSRGEFKKAVEEWRGPAVAGDPDAQFNLGQAYKLGRGVPADLGMAEVWYRKAALQGHAQAEDNYGLALFQNNKRDEALKWLEKSAARGEPRAQFVLGTMLFNGDAVTKDWPRAYALVTRASGSGLPQAATSLAQMDKYVSLKDRQAGLALARQLETQAQRSPLPTGSVGDDAPAPKPTAVAKADVPASKAAPAPFTNWAEKKTPPPAPTPKPAAPKPAAASAPKAPAARTDGGWRIQLGAFRDAGNARDLWSSMSKVSALSGTQPDYQKAGAVTRLVVGPFASSAEANQACAAVKRAGGQCLPVRK